MLGGKDLIFFLVILDLNMSSEYIAVILTGGKSSRMNFVNKSFLEINNKSFIQTIIETLKMRFDKIVININKDKTKYQKFNLPIVTDVIKGFKGPLAGLHAAMKEHKFQKHKESWFVLVPTDSPFIPLEYFDNFIKNNNLKSSVIISEINGKIEPVFSFWSIKTFQYIEKKLLESDGLKIMNVASEIGFEILKFQSKDKKEFMNINTKEDLKLIEKLS